MIVIPAVDIRDGACVQPVGGGQARELPGLPDPVSVARAWAELGFRRLHVGDVDAALGRAANTRVVHDILWDDPAEIQVGGGIRSADRVEELVDDGAASVVVGSRAIEEPEWLAATADQFPGRLIVAVDVRERRVVTRGWERTLARDVLDVVRELNAHPLGGVLVTAMHREGRMRGTDLPLMEDVADVSDCSVFASGGVSSINELRSLADRGVAGAVLGAALYAGLLDINLVAWEFGG